MIFTESEDLGNNAKLFAQDIATLNDTTVSVSYTHLDVYKRQVFNNEVFTTLKISESTKASQAL